MKFTAPVKLALGIVLTLFTFASANAQKTKRSFYEIKVYHFKDATQEQLIDGYMEKALIPALHKNGISSVGVFKPIANDTAVDKKIYVLTELKSLDQLVTVQDKLGKDGEYSTVGKDFINVVYTAPAFTRMETIILQSFELAPVLTKPTLGQPASDRIYELRSYEGASEKIYRNKVKMFNQGGEIVLFKRLGFNAIFYGEVLVGSHQPNLMYMTSFDNMQSRTDHWKAFSADPEWKTLSALPEYQKNVSHIDIILMKAAPYSDL